MDRLIGSLLLVLVAVVLLGFALAHLGVVVLVFLALGLLGRHLRHHGA